MRISIRRRKIAAAVVGLSALGVGAYWAVGRARLAYQVYQVEQWSSVGDPKDRLEAIEHVAHEHGDCAALQYWLAVAYRRSGKLDRVEAPLKRARELGWSRKDIARQRYLTLFLLGELHESETFLQDLIGSDVSDDVAEEVYEALAKGYLADLRVLQARECLDHWLQWRPNNPRARIWLAELARVTRDDVAEEEQYRAIIKAEPDNFEGHIRLATFLVLKTRIAEANDEYLRCLEINPDDPAVLIGLAECQQRMGRVNEACVSLERAMALPLDNSQRGFALTTLGQIQLRQRKTAEAVKTLKQASELFPADPGSWYALGLALSQSGKKEEAARYVKHSKSVAGNNAKIVELYLKVIETPDDVDARFKLAEALLKYGQPKNASGFFHSVLDIDPNHGPTHAALADFYASNGRDDLAAPHRERAAVSRSSAAHDPRAAERDGGEGEAALSPGGAARVSAAAESAGAVPEDRHAQE